MSKPLRYLKTPLKWVNPIVILSMIIFNLVLQIGLCRSMTSFVELKNRLILGSLLMPSAVLFGMWISKLMLVPKNRSNDEIEKFFSLSTVFFAFLSPLTIIFYQTVQIALVLVVGVGILAAASITFGPWRLFRAVTATFDRARRHAGIVWVIPIFFFVFLCEINDQWDVYEADGPYYGQFAKNLLRYDLTYTCLLRTHGTGDVAFTKTEKTHNLRHPPGYIWYVTAWYLVVGSELPRILFRILPLLSNFVFLLLLYEYVLKMTEEKTVAVCASLIYVLIPIASTFGNKIHQLSILHLLLLLSFIFYDKLLDGSRNSVRILLLLCVVSLLTDWYLFVFWPLIWLEYLVRTRLKQRNYKPRFLFLLPVACIATSAVIFGQMVLGDTSLNSFQYIVNLRFKASYIKQFTMESFNSMLVKYLVRDYTGFVYQLGAVWPFIFLYRVFRAQVSRLDVFTFLLFVYALVNIYVFQKIFIHYFEVIHFLLYAIFATTLTIHYLFGYFKLLGNGARLVVCSIVILSMLPDTVDGIRYFRLRHGGAYIDGYAEAAEYVRGKIAPDETVVTNRIFNEYSNERHIITRHLVQCTSLRCFQKLRDEENVAYAILFEKPFNAELNAEILTHGDVRVFHDKVVVVSLKSPKNLLSEETVGPGGSLGSVGIALNNTVELSQAELPEVVHGKEDSFWKRYFFSLNEDKFPEEKYPVLQIDYTYRKFDNGYVSGAPISDPSQTHWRTEIRNRNGDVLETNHHSLTELFYKPSMWPKHKFVHESLRVNLRSNFHPGEYDVYIICGARDVPVGSFYFGHSVEQIEQRIVDIVPKERVEQPISKSMRLVGASIRPKTCNPGDTVHLETFLETFGSENDVVYSKIHISDLWKSDFENDIDVDPPALLFPEKIYCYDTPIKISKFAVNGRKAIEYKVNGKSIPLGFIQVESERISEDIVYEKKMSFPKNTRAESRQASEKATDKRQKLDIRFKMEGRMPVRLMLEAAYADSPRGYVVVVDAKGTHHNGGARQIIMSDIVADTVLSGDVYSKTIDIPSKLIISGENHVIIEAVKPPQSNISYPGFRNLLFKLFAPSIRWLGMQKLTPELPLFTYVGVDLR